MRRGVIRGWLILALKTRLCLTSFCQEVNRGRRGLLVNKARKGQMGRLVRTAHRGRGGLPVNKARRVTLALKAQPVPLVLPPGLEPQLQQWMIPQAPRQCESRQADQIPRKSLTLLSRG